MAGNPGSERRRSVTSAPRITFSLASVDGAVAQCGLSQTVCKAAIMQKLLAVAFLGALCAAPALSSRRLRRRRSCSSEPPTVACFSPTSRSAGAKTERTWQVEREDPAAARQRAIDVKAEANLVTERVQRMLDQHAAAPTKMPCGCAWRLRRARTVAGLDAQDGSRLRQRVRRRLAGGALPRIAPSRSAHRRTVRHHIPIAPSTAWAGAPADTANLADQDRPEIVDVGEGRAGHDQVAEAGEERVGVVAVEVIAGAQAEPARSLQRIRASRRRRRCSRCRRCRRYRRRAPRHRARPAAPARSRAGTRWRGRRGRPCASPSPSSRRLRERRRAARTAGRDARSGAPARRGPWRPRATRLRSRR